MKPYILCLMFTLVKLKLFHMFIKWAFCHTIPYLFASYRTSLRHVLLWIGFSQEKQPKTSNNFSLPCFSTCDAFFSCFSALKFGTRSYQWYFIYKYTCWQSRFVADVINAHHIPCFEYTAHILQRWSIWHRLQDFSFKFQKYRILLWNYNQTLLINSHQSIIFGNTWNKGSFIRAPLN